MFPWRQGRVANETTNFACMSGTLPSFITKERLNLSDLGQLKSVTFTVIFKILASDLTLLVVFENLSFGFGALNRQTVPVQPESKPKS